MSRDMTLVDLVDLYSNRRFTGVSLDDLRQLLEKAMQSERAVALADTPPKPVRAVNRRLGHDQLEQIAEDYRAGVPTTQLMVDYSISKSSVLRILRDQNVTMRRQPMSNDQITAAVTLYTAGRSIRLVASELGIPNETIRLALLAAGVTLRASPHRVAVDSIPDGLSFPADSRSQRDVPKSSPVALRI